LPDADVLIQVSGKYGSSRRSSAPQGLRPKADRRSAHFYTLVSLRTCEEESLAIDNFFWQNRATAIGLKFYVVVILCCKLPGINYTCMGMEKIPEVMSAI